MRTLLFAGSLAVALSLSNTGVAFAQTAAPRYAVTDIGGFGGETFAEAINSTGQVVGYSYLTDHTPVAPCDGYQGFLYENGVMQPLPLLQDAWRGYASGINERGDVSGVAEVLVPDNSATGCSTVQTPILVRDGVAIDLSAPEQWYGGITHDLNTAGQVVGWSWTPDGTWHAYLWEIPPDGIPVRTDLHPLDAAKSIAYGVNDQGVVVGILTESSGVRAFRWRDGVMTRMPVFGTDTVNAAYHVNAGGDAVGISGSGPATRPVLYPASGGVIDLGSLGGTEGLAYSLNDRRSVVGWSLTGDNHRHAILHTDGQLWDLNALLPTGSGWELVSGIDINNAGWIVGYGCKDSQYVPPGLGRCRRDDGTFTFRRAFLLTPVASIKDLRDLISSFDLRQGLESSLLAKLAAAENRIDAGQTEAACSVLRAFANEVKAQSGKGLTEGQATTVLERLGVVRADLGCGG